MEGSYKIEPDKREWLSHEDFTHSKTSHSNVGLEDVVATEDSIPSFIGALEDLMETKISPETLCQSSDVGVKLESVEDENIPEFHQQPMQVNVKVKDEAEYSSLPYSQLNGIHVKLEDEDIKVVDIEVEKSFLAYSQFRDNFKLEDVDIEVEESSTNYSQFSHVKALLQDDIKAENSSHTFTQFNYVHVKREDEGSQSIDVSDKIKPDGTIITEISSMTSPLGIHCQEPCNVNKGDQSCTTTCEGPVYSSSLGTEVTSMVLKTVQDNNDVDSCDQSLNGGLHEDIQIEIDVDETTDSCVAWQEPGTDFQNNHDTTLDHLSTNHNRPDQRFDFSEIDEPEVDTKSQNTTTSQLQNHSRLLTGERPYKCMMYGKAFTRNSHLQVHVRTHTEENPFNCVTCGKAFTQNSDLQVHVRTHTGKIQFKCPTCGKAFTRKSHLQVHVRTHTEEKPFKCVTCGEAFILKADLHQHVKTHTGEKPFKCVICGKAFTLNSHLKGHFRTHKGLKPFKCVTCGKAFTQNSQLQAHVRTHHPALGGITAISFETPNGLLTLPVHL